MLPYLCLGNALCRMARYHALHTVKPFWLATPFHQQAYRDLVHSSPEHKGAALRSQLSGDKGQTSQAIPHCMVIDAGTTPRHWPSTIALTISRSRLFLLLRLHRREQKLWERLCSQVQLPYQTAWDFKKCILTVKCNHAYICIKLMNTLRYSFRFLTMLSFC